MNECLRDGLQTMFPALSRGIPEINVEKFEPLFIKEVGVSKGHGAVLLTGALHDLFVYGPSNATTTFVVMDLKNKTWQFGIEVPYLKLESQYNIKGNILLLPVVGTGDSIIHLRDTKCIVTTDFEYSTIQNREILQITKMKVDFSVSGMRLHLSNLFNGNKDKR
ncbi:Circadian clock-controlled protein precursor, putative [Pediculus humanus corporis]|uniref:Circadian clock-controlled protein, putative n=1 Tax=Pediculus humanus subsp. corporis TaxID=121224 RepID=E0VZJ4_PEDHC|nr:Circadian clock-controlled protein precursor, putative [Pediculus humanus corporis]EEB18800.1 Circadian clock-controlled protein precursor, putative [Pediculus humanus corporis]